MPRPDFDVIVAGAGPAGGMAARTAAAVGLRTALVEEHEQPGLPAHCSGKLQLHAFREFDLPASLVMNTLRAGAFYSPGGAVFRVRREEADYQPPFELVDYVVTVQNRQGRGTFAEANVKINIKGEIVHTAAEGNGPVNALDAALRKALTPLYPQMNEFHLSDYKVRILDGRNGTAATTRVLIDTRNSHHQWGTVGASTNIIEASWQALLDSVEYGLWEAKEEAEAHV